MQSLAEKLASLPPDDRAAALASITDQEAKALLYDWRGFLARPDQVAPSGDWDVWIALAGRGWGKTRTGAEWVREKIAQGCKRIAIIAETQKDLEQVMVEGDSGLLSVFPEAERPKYTKKPVTLQFPNGAIVLGYNATEPDQLRGPQFDAAWCDELAKWRYARETWDMLQFGLRLGDHPKVFVTTTPRPIEIVRAIVSGDEGRVVVTKGKTVDNRSNLAPTFLSKIQKKHAGTRLGRQELEAEILGDLPNALWVHSVLDTYRVSTPPKTGRVVVSVDPAVTNTEDSDEHGLIVAGVDDDQTGYLLEDASMTGSPMDWARKAIALAKKWNADGVVVEVNQGGDMVAHTLRSIAPNLNIIEVRATKGKHVRAEPIASLYEQGRIRHVGSFPELENQMTQMTTQGYQGGGSPDRVDALVWAFTDLFPDMTETIADASRFEIPAARRGWMG
jgi:phage terminase large subunit-like protein